MAKLVVFGATGYVGSRIAAEAKRRGHDVVAVARNVDGAPGGRAGSIHDAELVRELSAGADVLVSAIHGSAPGGEPALIDAVPTLIETAASSGARLGVVGGAGSLLVSADGPRLVDTPGFPDEYKPEALAHAEVLEALRANGNHVDWFYLSPAANFGAHIPGERTGDFRVSGDIMLTVPDGPTTISGDDYAIAFVDEVDRPQHRRARFSVAY
jgi:hypothetical protein